jgi:hypothetical protein
MNPTDMLRDDHAKIRALLKSFDEANDEKTKQQLIARTLAEIAIHGALREELVIPAIRETLQDSSLADSGASDYEQQRRAMEEISATQTASTRTQKFQSFIESVKRELEGEEQRLVPKLQGMELPELGERMEKRRKELERVRLFL